MDKKFSSQDVIDMGSILYDEFCFSREIIWKWLGILKENGKLESGVDVDAVFDLIVG